ncbi:hypothetical protein FQR65_LT19048 [Abscondita terminalis]|nr:hypothetical protein FQR65_LT19048 [Abscondita terminalis]
MVLSIFDKDNKTAFPANMIIVAAIRASTGNADRALAPYHCYRPSTVEMKLKQPPATTLKERFCSKIYENAVAKLKHLEDASSVSQSETEPEKCKRNKKTTKVWDDFQYSSGSSEDSDVPPPPRLARDNGITRNVPEVHRIHAPIPIEKSTVNSSNCRTNDGLIQKMMQSLELLSHGVKYLIQLSQLNSNIVSNDLPHNPALEQLPVYTVEQLLKFNESLQDKQVMAAMVCFCYFKASNHSLCIGDFVVRKNPLSRNSIQQEIQAVIKVWLRNAPDRDGGRMHRKQNSNKVADKE